MIDIPLGKALVPVEARKGCDCRDCAFYGDDGDDCLKCGGKHLACWCPLDKPCHADILLEIVNGEKE